MSADSSRPIVTKTLAHRTAARCRPISRAILSPSRAEAEGTGTQILGASPETLVRLEGEGALKKMTVRPLAGTRPRGRSPAEDGLRATELLADPKERAEHVMLIDLGRNDVGRVANVGSVRLPRRMEIERYSHVMHLVSEVEGDVDTSRISPFEVLRAAFPAGTLSGAPKLRAMQIIRELEPGPRGVYGGAVGYFADTAISTSRSPSAPPSASTDASRLPPAPAWSRPVCPSTRSPRRVTRRRPSSLRSKLQRADRRVFLGRAGYQVPCANSSAACAAIIASARSSIAWFGVRTPGNVALVGA